MTTTSYCANTVMTARHVGPSNYSITPPPARSKKVPSVAPVYTRYRGALFTLTHTKIASEMRRYLYSTYVSCITFSRDGDPFFFFFFFVEHRSFLDSCQSKLHDDSFSTKTSSSLPPPRSTRSDGSGGFYLGRRFLKDARPGGS